MAKSLYESLRDMADKIERANANIERVDPNIYEKPREVPRSQITDEVGEYIGADLEMPDPTDYRENESAKVPVTVQDRLLEIVEGDDDYAEWPEWSDTHGDAQGPSLYDLWEQGKAKPGDVDEDTWQQVGTRYHQYLALDNTPEEFFPGYEERMEILSGDDYAFENDADLDGSSTLEVEIPANLTRDYDLEALQDLGIQIEDGKATILVDAQGSAVFPDGHDSYTGRFIKDLQSAQKPAFEAKAQALQEAQEFEDTLLEIGAMGMVMRPQKAEDGSTEYLVDYRSDSPGFERGNADTPASANIVGSLPEALSTAKDMAAQRDKVLTSIAEAQVVDTNEKSYVVLSADQMTQAVAAAKGEGVATARTIEGTDVSISITDDGVVATSGGHTMRAVKEDSGAHLAEVKAEFADQDITISKVAATGEYRVDFRQGTVGYQSGDDGSASFQDSVTDAALDAKARIRWREDAQSETRVDTDDDDKKRLRLVAS